MSEDRRKLIERYSGRPSTSVEQGGEDIAEYQPAGPVSGNRQPEIMLELRFKAGDAMALSYALLSSAKWNRSDGIVLEFTTHRVQLSGRNLRNVWQKIVDHCLPFAQEFNSRTDDQPEDAVVISSIQVTPL